ncbi:hypothetical protein DFJ74DRAFT_770049 [Hyaloraphidium curvatum]|nr:hypothetical protein DFJ74DRAFT_770049 [Hyaloraphidium curvatum]
MPSRRIVSGDPPTWPKVDAALSAAGLFALAPAGADQSAPRAFSGAPRDARALLELALRDRAASGTVCIAVHGDSGAPARSQFHDSLAAVASALRALLMPKYGSGRGRVVLHASHVPGCAPVGSEWLHAFWAAAALGREVAILDEGVLAAGGDSASEAAMELGSGARCQFVGAERLVALGLAGSGAKPKEAKEGEEAQEHPSASFEIIRPVATVLLPPPGNKPYSAYPSAYHAGKDEGDKPGKPAPSFTPWPEFRHESGNNPFWTDLAFPSPHPPPGPSPALIHAAAQKDDRARPLALPLSVSHAELGQHAFSALYADLAHLARAQRAPCEPASGFLPTPGGFAGNKRGALLAVFPREAHPGAGAHALLVLALECALAGRALHLLSRPLSPEKTKELVSREGIETVCLLPGAELGFPLPGCVEEIRALAYCAPGLPPSFPSLPSELKKDDGRAVRVRTDLGCAGVPLFATSDEPGRRFRVLTNAAAKGVGGRVWVRAAGQGGWSDAGVEGRVENGANAQFPCGPLGTQCDINAQCVYHYGSEYCSCNSGYEGTGVLGDCTEILDPLQYEYCRYGSQCCGEPLGRFSVATHRECETYCDDDGRCTHIAFQGNDAAGGECVLFASCSSRREGGHWQLSARNLGTCPSRSGCSRKVDLYITVTHASVRRGQQVTLRATVRRADNNQAARNVRINFTVRGAGAGSATTNHQGVATVRYRYPSHFPRGRQSYRASHPGSSGTNAGQSDGTLNVS